MSVAEVEEPSYWEEADYPILWATFDVLFPPQSDVIITAEYDIPIDTGHGPVPIDYVLETGAGWSGPIVLADISVRLPFPNCPATCMWYSSRWPNPSRDGDVLTWRRWGFEPTRDDNFRIVFATPPLWPEIQSLESLIANGQATVDDYLSLAELYWIAGTRREVIAEPRLIEASETTLRRATWQFPRSSDVLARLAFVQWEQLRQPIWMHPRVLTPEDLEDIHSIQRILQRALRLDPANAYAHQILERINTYEWPEPLAD